MIYTQNKKITLNVFMIITLLFLPTMFLADGISKYLAVNGSEFYRLSLFVRLIFEVIVLGFILKDINVEKLSYVSLFAMLFSFFILGQLLIGNENNLIENIISFNKYIFLFLSYLFFQKILYLKKNQQDLIYSMIKFLMLANILCIFSGFMFDINFFETDFDNSFRYGYNGVYFAGNESSFILICMVGFLYFRAYYENGSKLFLLIALLTSMLSGMKAVYLFLLFILLFHLFHKMKNIHLIWLTPICICAIRPVNFYIQSEDFQNLIQIFINIYEDKGLLTMMLSGRDEILANESILVIENWTFLNYFIGGRDVVNYNIEMDFFDLSLFFGAFGSLIYIFIFFKFFIQRLLWHKFFIFFIFTILLLAFLGGHFLESPSSAVYFSLVIIYFQNYKFNNIEHRKKICATQKK